MQKKSYPTIEIRTFKYAFKEYREANKYLFYKYFINFNYRTSCLDLCNLIVIDIKQYSMPKGGA